MTRGLKKVAEFQILGGPKNQVIEAAAIIILQATKLFIVTSATKGGWLPPLP